MSLAPVSAPPAGPITWKRRAESEEEGEEKKSKIPRLSWYVTLESESPQPTDEDDESIHSIQGKETDYARDPSDTSTHTWASSESGDVALHVEYEVASLSESDNSSSDCSSSSNPDDIVAIGVLAALCDSDLGQADDSNDSRSSVDSEIGRADYWTCVQCKATNNNPLFRYCEKCYQACWQCRGRKRYCCFPLCAGCFKIRKNLFPPRPKWRRPRFPVRSRNHPEQSEKEETKLQLCSMDSGLGSSQTPSETPEEEVQEDLGAGRTVTLPKTRDIEEGTQTENRLCITCASAPKDGAFVHNGIIHLCCCYNCARKVWKKTKRCPICNGKIRNVFKVFYH